MRSLIASLLIARALSCPAVAETLAHQVTACKSLATFQDYYVIAYEQHDELAATKLIRKEEELGNCTTLQPGSYQVMETTGQGYACARKKGEPDCYWTFIQVLK
jgi:hypothetical protein